MTTHVDRDTPELVAQRLRERIEQPRAEPIGVLQQQRRTVATPIEGSDPEAIVGRGDEPRIHRAQRIGLP
jgi:hypothetical protein